MTQVKVFVALPAIADSAAELGVSRRTMQSPSVVFAMEEARMILLKWERLRFIRLSVSGGGRKWRDIKNSTKKRKARKLRRGQATAKPTWIMRENDNILMAIDAKKSVRGRRGFNVGILHDRPHSHSKLSVGNLASLHNPIWPIVEKPPPDIMERIQAPVIEALNKEAKREERIKAPPKQAPPIRNFRAPPIRNFRPGRRR
jgi:hypothetical protein